MLEGIIFMKYFELLIRFYDSMLDLWINVDQRDYNEPTFKSPIIVAKYKICKTIASQTKE